VTRIRTTEKGEVGSQEIDLKVEPVPTGYVDFLPESVQMALRNGPMRTSLGEDLCYYLERYNQIVDILDPASHATLDPDVIALFLKKIIASHYSVLFDYFRKMAMSVRRPMQKQQNFKHLDLTAVESNWSDVQTLERRLGQYCLDIEDILIQLNLPLEPPDPSQIKSWEDTAADFRLHYHRFNIIRQQSESVNQSIAALASISGNRRASVEQKRAKVLVLIGLGFIPLAFFASLFSMAEPFAPGGDKFWVYLAISIPCAILVYVAYYLRERFTYKSVSRGIVEAT
jgi:hypothetical protein